MINYNIDIILDYIIVMFLLPRVTLIVNIDKGMPR